jgi:hypothetical protein
METGLTGLDRAKLIFFIFLRLGFQFYIVPNVFQYILDARNFLAQISSSVDICLGVNNYQHNTCRRTGSWRPRPGPATDQIHGA